MAPLVPSFNPDRAFERLYRRYAGDVYRYALALLRNPADAEDATQTTFMNAYRAMQRGEEPRKPQNWLITITHNACRKRFAHAARRVREVPFEESLAAVPVAEDERPSVEGVLDALGRLPFNQRAALVMRELEGRSYTEIADTLGVSRSAVEALLFRARRSLRVHRATLRSLGAVQLPASLARFFEEPASLVGGGTAVAGSGLLAKVAAVLTLGAVASGGAVADAHHQQARTGRANASLARVAALRLGHSAARIYWMPTLHRDAARLSMPPASAAAQAHARAGEPTADAGASTGAGAAQTPGQAGAPDVRSPDDASTPADSAQGSVGPVAPVRGRNAPRQAVKPVTAAVAAVSPVPLPAPPAVSAPTPPPLPAPPVSVPAVKMPTGP